MRRLSQIVQYHESVCARITKVFLCPQNAIDAVIVLCKFHETV